MEAEFQCTNCEGSGYFDTPGGGEVACSVCRGKAAYSPDEIARMEAAEATITQLREIMASQAELIDDQGRAMTAIAGQRDAAEAENKQLRETVNEAMELHKQITGQRNTYYAECERLRAQVATLRADVALMLTTPHNHDWLPSDDCQRCAVEQRLAANTSQDAAKQDQVDDAPLDL